ncbi:MAG: hypothetical protein ACK5Q5_14990 [Planctomycetaceae bacterium]
MIPTSMPREAGRFIVFCVRFVLPAASTEMTQTFNSHEAERIIFDRVRYNTRRLITVLGESLSNCDFGGGDSPGQRIRRCTTVSRNVALNEVSPTAREST